jgi:hypothetical protein
MHRTQAVFTAVLLVLLAVLSPATAQDRDRDREEKRESSDKSDFASRLWYGGSIGLGFSGYNGASQFGIGVSPMVGYKILPFLSVGPRVAVNYTAYKERGFKTLNLFNTEAGGFLRARVYRWIFVQGELSNEWRQEGIYQYDNNGQIELGKETVQRFNQYLGAGYNSAAGLGGFGYEIGVFYNLALTNDIESAESPWDVRVGLTWNF